jgi:translation initiation factor 4A
MMDDFPIIENFEDMNLKPALLRGIYTYGFDKPSVVQQKCTIPIIRGRDTIVQAMSGTGKTAAFTISMLQLIDTSINRSQALVIAPTRELALGICHMMENLGKFLGVTAHAFIGGTAVRESLRVLERGVQVVLGTPGRLLDLMNRRFLQPCYFRMLIIDEFDEILARGFEPQIRELIKNLPQDIQIVILSCTFPHEAKLITEQFMRDPVTVFIRTEDKTLEGIKQFYIPVQSDDEKRDVLFDLLESLDVPQLVIYVNKASTSEELAAIMTAKGLQVEVITSDMEAIRRASAERRFMTGEARYLIKTDLLGQYPQVACFMQYDLPSHLEVYLHRIGRSGCYGRKGVSIAFVGQSEVDQLKKIQTFYNTVIQELPSDLSEIL